MDAFVHASGDGFGNTAPLRSDTGAIDMDAISQVAHVTQGAGKLTRKEKKHAKREMKRRKKEAKKAEKEAKKTYSSIKSQLKDRDKELSDKMADARKKRDSAKDVVNYIGYNKMYQDGICEVEEGMFSSSIAFDDTSYHSVRDEQQKAMFSAITRLYDQFGADTLVQMSVINTPLLKEEVGHRKFFDPERQANDAARNDAQVFNNILNDKVKEGVSNIRRNRYLTYSVTADTAEDAARQLSRIEVESSRILNSIGSKAHLMNGTQRLSVIHSLLNPYKPFLFDYQRDISAKRLQTTKDCIAPTQIDFRPDGHYNDCVKLDNGVYAQVLVMKKFGSELSDRALADMADLPIPMAITWYVQPMDKSKAINYVRTRSAWIDKEIIEEQRSAVNKGYDFSILPQELKYSKEETEDVLDHLQNKNQRLYVFTGLVYTYAESKEALDTQVLRIISTARQNSIELDTYDYRQRQGLNSILPLGHNHVEISRMFTTAQVSILVPFATQELDDAGGNFYGQNKHSRNLVVCNRKKLTSPMGFVCGKTGSGKGMFTKTEMTGTIFSNPTDEIYVIDRAGEYTAIAERYGGSTYHFGVGTGTHLNPFDTVSVEHMTRNEQIVLYGKRGTGKSFHASCIANAVIERGFSCLVTDIKQVVNLMESSFEKRSGNLERILAPDLLILEDLGAQRSTEYVMEHVYDVIDGRYKAGKPMVITTNFDFRERILNATADDPWGRVFDRIVEVGFPVKYDGNSRRREIGMKNRKDFKRKLGIEGIES